MSPFLRRLVACLMFVLLPFQALAAPHGQCGNGTSDCAEMMMQGDCCDHEASAGASSDGAHHCVSAAGCMSAAYAIAIPAEIRQAAPAAAASDIGPASPTFYRSFIPEALQRPPRTLC